MKELASKVEKGEKEIWNKEQGTQGRPYLSSNWSNAHSLSKLDE
jgi:hypothetical protein